MTPKQEIEQRLKERYEHGVYMRQISIPKRVQQAFDRDSCYSEVPLYKRLFLKLDYMLSSEGSKEQQDNVIRSVTGVQPTIYESSVNYLKLPFIRPTKLLVKRIISLGFKPLCLSQDDAWILYDGSKRPKPNEYKQVHVPLIRMLRVVIVIAK